MKHQPINPVTFTGAFNNVSVGRLWLGTDRIQDGQHHHAKTPGGTWEKAMTLVFWTNPEMPVGVIYIDDEEEFIKAIKVARTGKAVAIKGVTQRNESDVRTLELKVAPKQRVALRLLDGDNKSMALSSIEIEHFDRGLCHLFPKGELDEV